MSFASLIIPLLLLSGVLFTSLLLWTWWTAATSIRHHPRRGILVPVTGGHMHVRDMGPRDAPPERIVVMIHGASCNHMSLVVPLAEPLLAAGFRVIAVDRPGHGYSDRPGGRSDALPSRQAALIAEAMGALGVAQAIVLAHSFAGAIGTTLAMDLPDRVAGLMLIAPTTHPWPGGIAWYHGPGSTPGIDILFSNTLPVAGFALTAATGVEGVFSPQTAPDNYIKDTDLPLMLRPANFRANSQDVAGLLAHVNARAGRYGQIHQPVTIISGDSDIVVSTEIHSCALAEELPNARLLILPGVGHVPHHANTGLVVAEMTALSARTAAA